MKRIGLLLGLLALSLAAGPSGCLGPLAGGGGGSEAENGSLIGRVVFSDGAAAADAAVRVRPVGFLKDTAFADQGETSPDARADAAGRFQVASLKPGWYSVEVRDGRGSALLVAAEVKPGSASQLGLHTLIPTGKLQGRLETPPDTRTPGYVQVYGLDRVVRCDSAGRFAMQDLPQGVFHIHAVSPWPLLSYRDPGDILIRSDSVHQLPTVPLISGDSAGNWPYSRRLYLNTAAAGIKQTLTRFPLLVRLDSANFDFKFPRNSIGFATANGRPLPYEIERWDAQLSLAEIWVGLDTLWGDNAGQYIQFGWGRNYLPDLSGIGGGYPEYAGIWHMHGTPKDSGQWEFRDANFARPVGIGPVSPANPQEFLGPTAHLEGMHYVRVPGHGPLYLAAITLSAWIKTGQADSGGSDIAGLGNSFGIRLSADGKPSFYLYEQAGLQDTLVPPGPWKECRADALDLRDNQWHHVAGVFDGAFMRILVDGVEGGVAPFPGRVGYALQTYFWMGARNPGPAGFQGYLDEVRVYAGDAWKPGLINADFQSQRSGSLLVEFR